MDFKKGGWNPGPFDPESYTSDLLDDKMAKNIIGDLKKNLPPGGFPKHKPLLANNLVSGGGNISSSKPLSKQQPKRGISSGLH